MISELLVRRERERLARSVFVRADGSAQETVRAALSALAMAKGYEALDWSQLPDDVDYLTAVAIDLAEDGGWTVVLDGVSVPDDDTGPHLLRSVARFARDSRWLVTSRSPLRCLETLSWSCALDYLDALDGLEAPAGRAQQQRSVAPSATQPGSARRGQRVVASSAPHEIQRAIERLALAEVPLPRSVLGVPDDATLTKRLRRLDATEWDDGRVLLSPEIRKALWLRLDEPKRMAAAAALSTGIADATEPTTELLVEAIRLTKIADRADDAIALLCTHGWQMVRGPQAPRLWELLKDTQSQTLRVWALRAGIVAGVSEALTPERLDEAQRSGAEVALAHALIARGKPLEASVLATRALQAAHVQGNQRDIFEATLALVRSNFNLRRFDAAKTLLLTVSPPGDAAALERDLLMVIARSRLGEVAEARSMLATSYRDGLSLANKSPALRRTMLRAAYESGLRDVAKELLAENGHGDERVAPLLPDLMEQLLRCVVALESGELAVAEGIVKRLTHLPLGRTYLATAVRTSQVALALGLGDMRAAQEGRAALAALSVQPFEREFVSWLGQELDVALGEPPTTAAAGDQPLERLAWARHQRRWHPTPRQLVGPIRSPGISRQFPGQVEAEAILLDDRDYARALDAFIGLRRQASDEGYPLLATELTVRICDVAVLRNDWHLLAHEIETLRARSAQVGSPRFGADAELLSAIHLPGSAGLDWARLEQLATGCRSPVARRRARYLLGEDARVDRLDAAVIDAALASQQATRATSFGQGQILGGFDLSARTLWTREGETLQLRRRPIAWRVLASLARRGGRANKEELVRDVWREAAYHPLRHDNRLQVTVHKLRKVLESAGAHMPQLQTDADGYRIRGRWRTARASVVEPTRPASVATRLTSG